MNIRIIDIQASCRKLKSLCDEKGYSAVDMQKALGLESCQACYKWFSGKNLPSIDNLVIISDVLGVSVDEILVTKNVDIYEREW
ncbi:MAG: helix-turn-helix transcriptional regulator [Lachnospiraceae bacterium]|nr:helix-turn-helix transcriptional regulator [Lachnospiraceae bacterium]